MDDIILKIGALIDDMGKLGIIYRKIESGDLDTSLSSLKWRLNYEIYYLDGDLTVIGEETLKRLIINKQIRIIDHEPDEETLEKIKKYNKEIIDKRKK